MEYQMIDDKVLIKVKETGETQTAGGIVLPESTQTVKNQGTVISVGSGRPMTATEIRAMTVNIGDAVIFVPERCVGLEIDGKEHVVIRECDILCVIK